MNKTKSSNCLSDPKGDFDVNKFAKKYFNGGGHVNAAGGISRLSLKETESKLLSVLKKIKIQLNA